MTMTQTDVLGETSRASGTCRSVHEEYNVIDQLSTVSEILNDTKPSDSVTAVYDIA